LGHTDEANAESQQLFPDKPAFSTPKPERLLERIVRIASAPGELVLDCFAGSGTAPAVAHKMGRRWVAVEISGEVVKTYMRPRLRQVVDGHDPGGITESAGWEGGGGYTEAQVAPSMFEHAGGSVVLSDWASNGKLADHVAAQLQFVRQPEPPFAGYKGRTRLAVIDGMLTTGVADHLLAHLEQGETLTVVAVALEPGAEEHLREKRPGSRARKVPRDLVRSPKLPSRLVRIGEGSNR
jgi:adenine-specific DNA-methyltransferase